MLLPAIWRCLQVAVPSFVTVSDWISLASKAPAASRPKSVPPAPMGALVKWQDWMNMCVWGKRRDVSTVVAVAGSPKYQPASLLFAWVLQFYSCMCLRFLFGWPFAILKAETTTQSYRSDVSKSKSYSVTSSTWYSYLLLPAACDHCLPLWLQVTRKALHGAYRLALRCRDFFFDPIFSSCL